MNLEKMLRGGTRGFTLTDLVVALAVAAVFAAILFPSLAGGGDKQEVERCMDNLRQIGAALAMYAQDHDGWITACRASDGETWLTVMQGRRSASKVYIAADSQTWKCPAIAPDERGRGYGFNGRHFFSERNFYIEVDRIKRPDKHLFAADSRVLNWYVMPDSVLPHIAYGRIDYRHDGKSNVLFADGHVESGDSWPADARETENRLFWHPALPE